MWDISVDCHFPEGEVQLKEKMLGNFPACWSAVDGCHIPMKCPAGGGGGGASKEYHNFKNFYSIVLLGIVDSKYRFIWASCGYPGNSHDSIIIQSTFLWEKVCPIDSPPPPHPQGFV